VAKNGKTNESFIEVFNSRVNPDHRAVVYCEGLRAGTAVDFNLLWNRYLTINVGHEEVTILNAMGCTKNPDLLRVRFNLQKVTEKIF
jgi:hypothetical protein